jgi:purine-binding chemotaxis protein CheW
MSQCKQFCTFFLDGMLFGIEVLKVQEVIRYQEMTIVPLAPKIIKGLINLRGQIVTAIDLRQRFKFSERFSHQPPMNVVVRTEDGAVSLLVDEIGDVLEVKEEKFEPVPETISEIIRDLTKGVYKLKDKLLLVLETEKAASIDSFQDRLVKKGK